MATETSPMKDGFVEVGRVRVDERGRLTLAKPKAKRKAGGRALPQLPVTSYVQYESEDGTIMLMPMVEIPAREAWVYENPDVLSSLKRGLAQAAKGETTEMDFSAFAEDDE